MNTETIKQLTLIDKLLERGLVEQAHLLLLKLLKILGKN